MRHKQTGHMDNPSALFYRITGSSFGGPRFLLQQKALHIFEEHTKDMYKNEPYEMWFLNDLNDDTE